MKQIHLNRLDLLRIKKSLKEARKNRSVTETEAAVLEQELASAVVMEPQEMPHDIVTMNSIVRVSFSNSQKNAEFQIVYPENASIRDNRISIFSPIATALIGYRENDEIEWVVPGGLTRIRIEKIIFQPEAAGDFLL